MKQVVLPPISLRKTATASRKRFVCAAALLVLAVWGTPRSGAQAISPDAQLKTVTVRDGVRDIPAYTLRVPEGWHFDGTVFAPTDKLAFPSLVFRAYSADGLTEMQLEPNFSWTLISSKDMPGEIFTDFHTYLKRDRSAAEFAESYAIMVLHARVVGPMAVGDSFKQRFDALIQSVNQSAVKGSSTGSEIGDIAAIRAETTNGTFAMEHRVRVRRGCFLFKEHSEGSLANCSALVDILSAPKGQLDALVNYMDAHDLPHAETDRAWMQKVQAANLDAGKQIKFDPEVPHHDRAVEAVLTRQYVDLFPSPETGMRPHSMIQRYLEHEVVGVYSWADFVFALGAMPPADRLPLARMVYAWSSADGQTTYYTSKAAANPNGVFAGTWTVKSQSLSAAEYRGPQ